MRKGQTDSLWGWMVVLAAACNRIIIYGVSYSAGIVYVVALEVFDEGSGLTSWISSLMLAVLYFTCPLSGYLINKIGERKVSILGGVIASVGMTSSAFVNTLPMLILTYGIISGIGCGLTFMPGNVAVAKYFKKHRHIALAIASAGGGIGSFAFPPIIESLNKCYSWRGMFLILGGITLNITVFGLLFRPLQREKIVCIPKAADLFKTIDDESQMINKNEHLHCKNLAGHEDNTFETENQCTCETLPLSEYHGEDNKNMDVSKEKDFMSKHSYLKMFSFYVLVLNNFMYQFGASIMNGHMQAYAVYELNFSETNAAFLYTISGIMILVFKLLHGFLGTLSQQRTFRPIYQYLFSYLIGGISTLFLLVKTSYGIYFYSAILGISQAACGGPLLPTLVLDVCGIEAFGITYGLVLLGLALGQLVGSPIAGILYEKYKSYDAAFILAAVMMIISAIIMVYPILTDLRQRKKKKDVEIVIENNTLMSDNR